VILTLCTLENEIPLQALTPDLLTRLPLLIWIVSALFSLSELYALCLINPEFTLIVVLV
jgi:hypothetical protein